MIDYGTPLSYAGGTAGAAGGGSLLGALGRVLEPLDYPRQALYNLGRSAYRGITGEGSWDDALSALPGALGAVGGLAANAIAPGSGLLAGALTGGLAQGIGKAVDQPAEEGQTNRFEAPTTNKLLEALGGDPDSMIQNMALGMATDPMTFAGGFGGGRLGAQAGRSYGNRLENIARFQGPLYPGNPYEKIAGIMGTTDRPGKLGERLAETLANPASSQIWSEVPQGSSFLGQGLETTALKTPTGQVVGLSRPQAGLRAGVKSGDIAAPPTRPDIEGVLQATRSKGFPGYAGGEGTVAGSRVFAKPFRVEHMPMVETIADNMPDRLSAEGEGLLRDKLAAQGFANEDLHGGNFGQLPGGEWTILDPGGIYPATKRGSANYSGDVPHVPDLPNTPGTAPERFLTRLFRSPQSIRSELEGSANASKSPLLKELEALQQAPTPRQAIHPAVASSGEKQMLSGIGDFGSNPELWNGEEQFISDLASSPGAKAEAQFIRSMMGQSAGSSPLGSMHLEIPPSSSVQEIGHINPSISGARSPGGESGVFANKPSGDMARIAGPLPQDELYLRNLIIHGQLPSLPPASQKQWLEMMARLGYLPDNFASNSYIDQVVKQGGMSPFPPSVIERLGLLRF